MMRHHFSFSFLFFSVQPQIKVFVWCFGLHKPVPCSSIMLKRTQIFLQPIFYNMWQLTSTQSRWIDSTTGKRPNNVFLILGWTVPLMCCFKTKWYFRGEKKKMKTRQEIASLSASSSVWDLRQHVYWQQESVYLTTSTPLNGFIDAAAQ